MNNGSKDDLRIRLLIVDDEQTIRKLCSTVGEALGFVCLEAESGESALALLEEQSVHMILSDMVMPHMSGLEFLEKVKKLLPRTEVALMTGHGSIETAVQAMKLGAYDYITKPFSPLEELRLFLRRMAEKVRLVEENEFLRQRTDSETAVHGIVGSSTRIQEVMRLVARLKDTRTPVLIYGESGTGKELVARAIHNMSSRRENLFAKLNCAAIPSGLLESELFGHEKGAFTGAIAKKVGRFEVADKGTLFLDEVGDIPSELQPKLLRVLQEQEFERLGSSRSIQVDVRLVAATNQNLGKMVEDRLFRADLYYRLNVFPIKLPALRERREDIPLLTLHFVQHYGKQMNKAIDVVPPETMEALMRYDWPGNIRELQNFVERAVILSHSRTLSAPISELNQPRENYPASPITLEEAEREHILRALRETQWVLGGTAGAANRLGMPRTTLIYKMRRLGISRQPD